MPWPVQNSPPPYPVKWWILLDSEGWRMIGHPVAKVSANLKFPGKGQFVRIRRTRKFRGNEENDSGLFPKKEV